MCAKSGHYFLSIHILMSYLLFRGHTFGDQDTADGRPGYDNRLCDRFLMESGFCDLIFFDFFVEAAAAYSEMKGGLFFVPVAFC